MEKEKVAVFVRDIPSHVEHAESFFNQKEYQKFEYVFVKLTNAGINDPNNSFVYHDAIRRGCDASDKHMILYVDHDGSGRIGTDNNARDGSHSAFLRALKNVNVDSVFLLIDRKDMKDYNRTNVKQQSFVKQIIPERRILWTSDNTNEEIVAKITNGPTDRSHFKLHSDGFKIRWNVVIGIALFIAIGIVVVLLGQGEKCDNITISFQDRLNKMTGKLDESTTRNSILAADLLTQTKLKENVIQKGSENMGLLPMMSSKLNTINGVVKAQAAEFKQKLEAAMKVQIENQIEMENQIAEFTRDIKKMEREWQEFVEAQG